MVTVPPGGGSIGGTCEPCSGLAYPRSTSTVGPPSTANGTSTSIGGVAVDDPQPGQHLRVGQVAAGGRHPPPLVVGRRRILLWQKRRHRNRVGGQ